MAGREPSQGDSQRGIFDDEAGRILRKIFELNKISKKIPQLENIFRKIFGTIQKNFRV